MNKRIIKDGLLWGIALWFIGYVLGIIFFMLLPHNLIGWAIIPIGVVITVWILYKKILVNEFSYYLKLGVVWLAMAIVLDYLFLVQLLKPEDGYYKLDVYLYYLITFTLPLIVGWRKSRKIV